MQPDRVEKVKSLLALAFARPPEERAAFLNDACLGDPALRQEIDEYLGRRDVTDKFFVQPDLARSNMISDPDLPPAPTREYSADPRIGKSFSKYIIRSRVAEGGMGIVYLAEDVQLGREVALKILPEYFSMDDERLGRFRREARAISLINHPNIVTVFEIGQLDRCEFIVTEFVEGRTLRDVMRDEEIPYVEKIRIGSQIARALAAAHRAGVVHRDIKPENVMVRPDGYVKVLDFGLAKLSGSTRRTPSGNIQYTRSNMNRTMPGMIMGTVSYMSPEQAQGLDIDARTDIWGLGVVLYELFTGKLPFRGPTESHTIVAILEHAPPAFDPGSPALRDVILRALQKNPPNRYQTADEMSAVLDQIRQSLGNISDKNIGPAPVERRKVPGRDRSLMRKLAWIVSSVLFVTLLGLTAVYGLMNYVLVRPALTPQVEQTEESEPADPSPTPTLAETSLDPPLPLPSPSAMAEDVYVPPTPTPSPAPNVPEHEEKAAEPLPQPRSDRVSTSKQSVRKPPPQKPARIQDKRCIYNGSCK